MALFGDVLSSSSVTQAAQRARGACDELRWHEAMRRRWRECRVEATVRSAHYISRIMGGTIDSDEFRNAAVGAASFAAGPMGDQARALLALSFGVLDRMSALGGDNLAATEPLRLLLARFHALAVTASSDCVDNAGQPMPHAISPAIERRIGLVTELTTRSQRQDGFAVAALTWAEVETWQLFGPVNRPVALAVFRLLVQKMGLDPTGVAVPELHVAADPSGYAAALRAYATTGRNGWDLWVAWASDAMVAGVREGQAIADSIRRGRID